MRRIEGAVLRLFTKSVTVSELRLLDEGFRLVTLTGESLRGVPWTPGAKVQVVLGGWVQRTYTPLGWDPVAGSTQLLLYLHGDGPGAVWGRGLKQGDACAIFGPRDSLDLTALTRPALVFGDESSFGLVQALRSTPLGASSVTVVLEVSSKNVARTVLEQLGIRDAELVERQPNDAQLSELERVVVHHLGSGPDAWSCALSGKATSIQALSKRLRALGVARRQLRTKAYWAPGKTGLD